MNAPGRALIGAYLAEMMTARKRAVLRDFDSDSYPSLHQYNRPVRY